MKDTFLLTFVRTTYVALAGLPPKTYLRAADDGRLSLPRHHDDGATADWRPDSAIVLRRPATHPQYSEFCWIKFKIDDGEPLVIEDDGEPLVVIEDTVGTILLTDVDN